ncbi:MAG: hypothetical protein FJW69_02560 [Actinobacteria bacterium]|nr:hypothetical protein [Actinomycetota bacterium]MBM3713471.1 hypothetical protein [Actinomycetota bacterium]
MARRVYVREIYFYIMCLVAIILFIVGLVTIYDSAINYVKPITYMTRASMTPMYKEQYGDLSQAEIDKLIEEEIAASLNNEKIMAIKGLFRGALLLIIGLPLFIIHWKKAQEMWRLNLDSD